MTIVDARVRLPQECRPSRTYAAPARQTEQYDRHLNLQSKINLSTLAELRSSMQAQGISAAIMHAETEGGEDTRALNQALGEIVHSDNSFRGVGCVDLHGNRPGAIARESEEVASLGLVGVSIQPAFFGMDIDDRVLYPFYARCEDLGLIVCIHTGITYSRMHPLRHERPEMLDQVACDFPDLQIMACHSGWPWSTEFAAVALRHPTVYLEFGGIAPKYIAKPGTGWDGLFALMPNKLQGQILYGSDWPVISPERAISEWRNSGLNEETLTALFSTNAADLFGID